MNENPVNRKSITIKINGKERPFHDKEKEKGIMEEDASSLIEKRKRSHDKKFTEEVAAGSEILGEESFDWILPNDEPLEESTEFQMTETPLKKKGSFFERKKANTRIKNLPKGMLPSIFFAVFFAIVLGTGFGFILLKMVNTDQNTVEQTTSTAVDNSKTAEKTGVTTTSSVAAEKEAITTYIVQHIILSNEDAVIQEQTQLSKKGYISQRIDLDGKMIIYLGVASNIEDAKQMQKEMGRKKVAAFAKEITFSGGEVKSVSKEEKNFIESSPDIFNSLTNAVTAAQSEQSIPNDVKKELEAQKTSLDKLKIKEFKNDKIKTMATELASGLANGILLSQSSSNEDIQTIQKGLLTFLGEYSSL
ncbi:hypothetical protein [Niallia sp. 03133]|uniref:hypothetical protein n=1 Tax=Niallia sp. 03133 TaxID=3458060 RepID=UPI004043C010